MGYGGAAASGIIFGVLPPNRKPCSRGAGEMVWSWRLRRSGQRMMKSPMGCAWGGSQVRWCLRLSQMAA